MKLRFAIIALALLALALPALAGLNQYGVADQRNVTFVAPMRVGGMLLPAGDYVVKHTIEANEHIMVFTQRSARKPLEAKVKCSMLPLTQKAQQNGVGYKEINNEKVLTRLIFKGDLAEHVFEP